MIAAQIAFSFASLASFFFLGGGVDGHLYQIHAEQEEKKFFVLPCYIKTPQPFFFQRLMFLLLIPELLGFCTAGW